jgi:DNA polymerase III subunit beta
LWSFQVEIKGLSADQFPREFLNIKPNNEKSFELPIKSLQEATHLVNFASDKKEANSILNGICLEIGPKGLEIAATDGSRLAYYKIENAAFTEEKKVVIPFRSINEFSRMISGLDEEFVKCYLPSSSQIVFKTASRTLSSSLIDGNYPKYQQLIPLNFSHTAIVERVGLLSALERVSVLANEKSKVVKLLFEESGVLNISAQTPDLGEAEDHLDMVSYEGQDFSIAFNVIYMAECLRNLDANQVEIKMSEPLKPIVVSLPKDNQDTEKGEANNKNDFEYLYLLMPVQLKNN